MNIGTVAIIGSVLAGFLSVPAVGGITGDVAAAGSTLTGMSNDSFQETPRTVSEQISSDEMTKTVETAFGTISFHATSAAFTADLETPRHQISVERQSDGKTMSLTGETVDLVVSRSPQTVETTCSTPDGTVEHRTENGESTTTFTGSNQQQVEAACDEARRTLERKAADIKQVAADLGLVPNIEIDSVNKTKEAVVIRNSGETAVNLAGWTLADDGGNQYE
jgi:hypothetical protein